MAIFKQALYQRSLPRSPPMVFGTDHQNRIGMQHSLKGFQHVPAEVEVYLDRHRSFNRNGPQALGQEVDGDWRTFERQGIRNDLDANQTYATVKVRNEDCGRFQGAQRFRS